SPQSLEGMAHRRLAQTKTLGDPRQVWIGSKRLQHHQQIQILRRDIHGVNIAHSRQHIAEYHVFVETWSQRTHIEVRPMTTEHPDIVLKNRNDLVWEPMVPELGPHSPRFATLHSDTRTGETTILIEFPSAIHIPKHTHEKSETHFLLAGSHVFGHQGTLTEVREGGYFFMEGCIVH